MELIFELLNTIRMRAQKIIFSFWFY